MINVLIVDDEPFIRQGLKILIDWEKYGYKIVDEAGNGLEALEKIKKNKIDLIIADIKMPEMNGIELIEHVYNNISKKIKFIVLSGFYEFEYAKKAIKFDVADYILKPIQTDELIRTLTAQKEKFIEQEEKNEKEVENEKVIYDCHLNKIIKGKYDTKDLEYVEERISASNVLRFIIIEINYDNKSFAQLSGDDKRQAQHDLYTKISEFLEQKKYNVMIDVCEEKECYDIGFIYNKENAESLNLSEKEYISKLNEYLKENYEYDFCIYIGQKVKSVSELEASYKSANIAKMFSNFPNRDEIMYYDEVKDNEDINCNIEKQYMDDLLSKIEENDEEGIISCIDKFYQSLNDHYINIKIVKININYLLFNLIDIANKLDENIDQERILKYISSDIFNDSESRGSAKHLKEFSIEFANYLYQLRHNNAQSILSQIDVEISKHYMEKISLKSLSQKYFINTAYLGQIFKKKYNTSFKDYLTTYRIEKAADMLKRSQDKVYTIAESVGYSNTDYFINKFVQVKGKTPFQYRKQFEE